MLIRDGQLFKISFGLHTKSLAINSNILPMSIIIRRPILEDIPEINELFSITVTNNFKEEGIFNTQKEDAIFEAEALMKNLKLSFDSNNKTEHYLIACNPNKILGTIAYGTANARIKEHLNIDYTNTPEIKSVYILPDYQNQGIGSLLFEEMLKLLRRENIHDFCLDSGYKKAKQYWTKKLGAPICILEKYWSEKSDHMIWYAQLEKKNSSLLK